MHSFQPLMETMLLQSLPAVRRHGVHWHYTRPPVIDIEYEMDLHGVVTEWVLPQSWLYSWATSYSGMMNLPDHTSEFTAWISALT